MRLVYLFALLCAVPALAGDWTMPGERGQRFTLLPNGKSRGQTLCGGKDTGDALALQSNCTAYPRTARISTDMLTPLGSDFVYPSGSAAVWHVITHSPSITGIDVANPNIRVFNGNPTYTYTILQNVGFGTHPAMQFGPTWVAGAALGAGSDALSISGLSLFPGWNGTGDGTGRTCNQMFGAFIQPKLLGTIGTMSAMYGLNIQPSSTAGTTVTGNRGVFFQDNSLAGTTTNNYGSYIVTLSKGATSNFGMYVGPSTAAPTSGTYDLVLAQTAPIIHMEDTTAAAKDLEIKVDANIADFREAAGASGSLLALDLANNRVDILNNSGAGALNVGSTSQFSVTTGGLVGTYNNIATAGLGVPAIYSESISATKTANFTAATYTPPATAGRYRVGAVLTTTSATNTGTLQVTVDYKDSQGTTHTADVIPLANAAGAIAASVTSAASVEFHAIPTEITINNAATAIVLKVVITGTVSYTVAPVVEQLG